MSYRRWRARRTKNSKALGVGALLEGSVRRVGNRVRVSVQLINADNDVASGREFTIAFDGTVFVKAILHKNTLALEPGSRPNEKSTT